MLKYLVFSFIIATSTLSFADSIERVEVLGANNDGSKILIFRTHFGPSSQSPFANIEILSEKQEVLLKDGLFVQFGGEESFAQMKESLIKKHEDSFSTHGITLGSFMPAPSFSSLANEQLLVESDLLTGGEITRFHLYIDNENLAQPLSREVCHLSSPVVCKEIVLDEATTEEIKFGSVFKIGSYAWVFFFDILDPLDGALFYSQKPVAFSL